mmetsp:Transcript_70787/g.147463  ORF Transcript_70787/g.147463 Transcript_70787/m.147463 type:complete len:219 (-) Transcript_70787:22-678(-)|eukprot:CAMPEP_0181299978 /NCGR_PEP_ID=MMETSP1101-20121128/6639_1 /TAXON_ID=46948 /ORGANISM="Rhodomonas abbreviata, Strain Caron Lab Isolate" /LENGTH=218 /DNA_ID=CAMNT_0023405173 /DNA_START=616 /DNA_END=1272 /DNA_ORIENTATION=+
MAGARVDAGGGLAVVERLSLGGHVRRLPGEVVGTGVVSRVAQHVSLLRGPLLVIHQQQLGHGLLAGLLLRLQHLLAQAVVASHEPIRAAVLLLAIAAVALVERLQPHQRAQAVSAALRSHLCLDILDRRADHVQHNVQLVHGLGQAARGPQKGQPVVEGALAHLLVAGLELVLEGLRALVQAPLVVVAQTEIKNIVRATATSKLASDMRSDIKYLVHI